MEQLVGVAQRRNVTIPKLIAEERVYSGAEPIKTLAVQALCHTVTSGVWVKGLDNLSTAAELAQNGEDILGVGNHLSDADHPIRHHLIDCSGFGDFSRRLVFMAGLKMIERKPIEWLMPAENVIFIPTPFDFDNLKTGLKDLFRQKKEGLIPPQRYKDSHSLIEEYGRNLGKLNEEAKVVRARMPEEGKVIYVYPEATRSTTGYMQRASAKVVDYFPSEKSERYVLPMMVWGTENFNPPNQNFRLTRTELYMVVGRPFRVAEIWERDIESQTFQGTAVSRADVLMARLGKLAPEKVHPSLREFFNTLAEDYDPDIEDKHRYIPGPIKKVLAIPERVIGNISKIGLIVGRG